MAPEAAVAERQEVKQETDDTQDVIEQDGDILVRVDDDSGPETDSADAEQSEKDTQEDTEAQAKHSDEQKQAEQIAATDDADLPEKYRGKSKEEIIDMHRNTEKKMGEMSNELGTYRKLVNALGENDQVSGDEAKKHLSAEQLKAGYQEERQKLNQMDPDDEGYADQQAIVDQLNVDWMEKQQEELINNQFNTERNKTFLAEKKEELQSEGIGLSDDEFDALSDRAKQYAQNGQITDASIHHALLDLHGPDKVSTFYTLKGKQERQQEIMDASQKEDTKISVRGSGANAKYKSLKNMSYQERQQYFDRLSPEQLSKVVQKLSG